MDDLSYFRELMSELDMGKVPDLKSERFRNLYYYHLTETLDIGLAGPFYAIEADGHCDYIFARGTLRTPIDLFDWGLEIANAWRAHIQAEEPENALEKEDQLLLLHQADLIERLSYIAHAILNSRRSNPVGQTPEE